MRNPFNENNQDRAREWFSDFYNSQNTPQTDRIFRSTRQSDYLYHDLCDKSPDLQDLISRTDKRFGLGKTLEDLFTLLYSRVQQRNEPSAYSPSVLRMQQPFINTLAKSETLPKLKKLCENQELPTFSAIKQFASELDNLKYDSRLTNICKLISTVEMLKRQNAGLSEQAKNEIFSNIEKLTGICYDTLTKVAIN